MKGNFTHSLISVTLDTEWCIFCLIYLLYNVELFPVASKVDRGYTAQGVLNPNHANDRNPSSTEKESGVKAPNRLRKCDNSSRGGTPGNSWWWCAARFSKSILILFRTKNVILHTRFQTRPLNSIPVFRPGVRLQRKQKKSSNPFPIPIFPFLTHLELI